MANDPNRDILPVKETSDKCRGPCERAAFSSLAKYRRSELEDRYLRLYEENNDLKKLTHSQEGKIKKLGTKLLRVLGEKKQQGNVQMRRNLDDNGDAEELQMKILELQHENYSLKDKNTVLRQQLASHSRQHMAAHRSPVRIHASANSPRLSQRHTSVPNINEGSIALSNRQQSSDLQLRDDEGHIATLNEEIKGLHSRIEALQAELEKSQLINQKNKVGENIELIKLRRHNKQLEAQLRCSEHNLKMLQEEVGRLQKENEDALQIIAEKQNELIDSQMKTEETMKSLLECQELKETLNDLMGERDALRERCESLMETVREKPNEEEHVRELEKLLAVERSKTASLRSELETALIASSTRRSPMASAKKWTKTDSFTQTFEEASSDCPDFDVRLDLLKATEVDQVPSNVFLKSQPYNLLHYLNKNNLVEHKEPAVAPVDNKKENHKETEGREFQTQNIIVPTLTPVPVAVSEEQKKEWLAEKLRLERDTDCLREMLRAETQRCDFLENQVRRLQQELQLNEVRYKDVFQQRDLFFKLLDQSKNMERIDTGREVARKEIDREDENDCPTGGTYTKGAGTYTKNSPVKVTPINSVSAVSTPTRKGRSVVVSKVAKENHTVADRPIPVPRSRSVSAKVKKIVPPILVSNAKPNATVDNARRASDAVDDGDGDDTVESKGLVHVEAKAEIVKNLEESENLKVKVSILWLQLDATGRLYLDSSIQALYVDFTFLGVSNTEFETPQAMPKPKDSGGKCFFNYTTGVAWSDELTDRLKAVKDNNEEGSVLVFNVVSEPPGEESQVECIVVGTSTVSFHQFAFVSGDEDLLLPIYDVENNAACCGTLAVQLAVPPSICKY